MPDRVKFTKQDIGGEILPILTTGLYRNKLDTLREYIQNAIDAKCKKIEIVIDPDTIMVSDDGTGMNFDMARKAIKLGISEKNPKTNVGFRGIGLYSAYNLCDCVDIYTRAETDLNCNVIHIDFKNIRIALAEDQERKKQDKPTTVYLEKLLENAVYVDIDKNNTLEIAGTKAIMSDLLDEVYEGLNDWDEVMNYLRDVVPLPFRDDFKYAPVIQQKFKENEYNVVPVTLQIGSRREEIKRPYYNGMLAHGGEHPPEFIDITDGKQRFGFGWICINDARQVLKDTNLRGLLIKKLGFSVSSRNYLEPYFARPVFNRRVTGEIIIQNEDLIPNAARSDFEHNSTRQGFIRALPKFIRQLSDWANQIQEQDKAAEVLKDAMTYLRAINAELPAISRDKETLLKRNMVLNYLDRQIMSNARAKILKKIKNDDYQEAVNLLKGCEDFVKSALIEQHRDQRKIEQEVVKAIQREAAPQTETEARTNDIPTDIFGLIHSYGVQATPELLGLLKILDENYLKVNLDNDEYKEMINNLREYLEEQT